jgi:hypothetical protein
MGGLNGGRCSRGLNFLKFAADSLEATATAHLLYPTMKTAVDTEKKGGGGICTVLYKQ